MSAITTALAQAIARFEGFYTAGSVAQRNHNPGNLRAGPRAISKDSRGYAIYASDADGWADLERQVDLNISRGLTLQEFFGGKTGVYPGYAPAADNNQPSNYANTVAGWLGISSDQVLSQVPPGGFRQAPLPARRAARSGSRAKGKGLPLVSPPGPS